MIIESGAIIFFGLLMLAIKLPPKQSLTLLGYGLKLDLAVSVIAYVMHYGTFSGMMAAAAAGFMCSGFTSAATYAFGCIKDGVYYPGKIFPLDPRKLK